MAHLSKVSHCHEPPDSAKGELPLSTQQRIGPVWLGPEILPLFNLSARCDILNRDRSYKSELQRGGHPIVLLYVNLPR